MRAWCLMAGTVALTVAGAWLASGTAHPEAAYANVHTRGAYAAVPAGPPPPTTTTEPAPVTAAQFDDAITTGTVGIALVIFLLAASLVVLWVRRG